MSIEQRANTVIVESIKKDLDNILDLSLYDSSKSELIGIILIGVKQYLREQRKGIE